MWTNRYIDNYVYFRSKLILEYIEVVFVYVEREPERCARRNLRTGLSGVLGSVHSEGERKVRVRAKVKVRVKVRVRLKEFTLLPKRTSRSVRIFRIPM
jgi:hypothetical protein